MMQLTHTPHRRPSSPCLHCRRKHCYPGPSGSTADRFLFAGEPADAQGQRIHADSMPCKGRRGTRIPLTGKGLCGALPPGHRLAMGGQAEEPLSVGSGGHPRKGSGLPWASAVRLSKGLTHAGNLSSQCAHGAINILASHGSRSHGTDRGGRCTLETGKARWWRWGH